MKTLTLATPGPPKTAQRNEYKCFGYYLTTISDDTCSQYEWVPCLIYGKFWHKNFGWMFNVTTSKGNFTVSQDKMRFAQNASR